MKAKFPIPPKPYHFTATEEFWKSVDDWRRAQPDLPSRAESIRRLIKRGIEADKQAATKKPR
jgi:hypothetical protein